MQPAAAMQGSAIIAHAMSLRARTAACSSMNAAAALFLFATTAVNAIPQAARQQVLASFESDKARARGRHLSAHRTAASATSQLSHCPVHPWRLPCAVRRRCSMAGGQ
jgi:hypothetical protein